MKKKVVYLCGPINGCTDAEAKNWRECIKFLLGKSFETLDPMRRDYRGRELGPGVAAEIVDGDLQDLRNSDIMVRYWPQPSDGSAMEQFYMYRDLGKIVVLIVPEGCKPSPWPMFHASVVVKTEAEAVDYIHSLPRF